MCLELLQLIFCKHCKLSLSSLQAFPDCPKFVAMLLSTLPPVNNEQIGRNNTHIFYINIQKMNIVRPTLEIGTDIFNILRTNNGTITFAKFFYIDMYRLWVNC